MRAPVKPHHFWVSLFALWLFFLSGFLSPFLGTPGVIQAIGLRHVLDLKQQTLVRAEDDLLRLQAETERLEKSDIVQQREIRKTLGYAAPNELIFDFTPDSSVF